MKTKNKQTILKTFVVTLLLTISSNSYAYIDPNTGGFFFTSVLPFVYGILAALVVFWKRIVQAVKNIFSKKNDQGKN